MKYIKMGNSNIESSAIGMGCMRISEMSPQEVCRLIQTALSEGIDLFDHADIYGGGNSEIVFGKACKIGNISREKLVLQSKCGIRPGMFDFSKEYILESTEGILNRLGTEYLDVLMLHRPDTLMEPEEIAEAFGELKRSGKVKEFGVSNMNSRQIELLSKELGQSLIVNQLQFSLAHTGMIDSGLNVNMTIPQSIDCDGGILEYSRLKNITIQTWSSLQYGFFEGTFLNSEKYPELNRVLREIAAEKEVSIAAVAIAWILRHPANMQVMIGSTNAGRLREIAEATQIQLSRKEWYDLYLAAGNKLP